MSPTPQKSIRRPRFAVGLVVAGLAAVLAVAGCAAGQNTQTDSVEPAVNGATGQAGPIAIRDVALAYPMGGVYPSGGVAPLVLTIVNTGSGDDELVEVSSTIAEDVEVSGDRSLPARRTIQVGEPGEEAVPTPTVVTTTTPAPSVSATSSVPASTPGSASSSAPSSGVTPSSSAPTSSAEPVELGRATIVLIGLTQPLNVGKTYPVTFVFRNAGSITVNLPIAAPNGPRVDPTGAESE